MVEIFHLIPRFHTKSVVWNWGLTWKIPTLLLWHRFILLSTNPECCSFPVLKCVSYSICQKCKIRTSAGKRAVSNLMPTIYNVPNNFNKYWLNIYKWLFRNYALYADFQVHSASYYIYCSLWLAFTWCIRHDGVKNCFFLLLVTSNSIFLSQLWLWSVPSPPPLTILATFEHWCHN